jgi:hypothetical protein
LQVNLPEQLIPFVHQPLIVLFGHAVNVIAAEKNQVGTLLLNFLQSPAFVVSHLSNMQIGAKDNRNGLRDFGSLDCRCADDQCRRFDEQGINGNSAVNTSSRQEQGRHAVSWFAAFSSLPVHQQSGNKKKKTTVPGKPVSDKIAVNVPDNQTTRHNSEEHGSEYSLFGNQQETQKRRIGISPDKPQQK